MDKTELYSCPFCGGNPKLHKHKKKWYYECNADCWTRTKDCHTVEDARKLWNILAIAGRADNAT